MYDILKDFLERPEPFSVYTAEDLWTDEHISERMLHHHLDPATDLASRRPESIDRLVRWIESRLGLAGQRICDLGCGPGLYTERMAMYGASACGVDFSERSLNHARWSAAAKRLKITYHKANYLNDALPGSQHVVTLIYGDYCALSPGQRRHLLKRVHDMLLPGGHFVFDVFSRAQFGPVEEEFVCERNLMNSFWAEGDYIGFKVTHRYNEIYLGLDRYLIVEPGRQRQIYNWMQYLSPHQVELELKQAGLTPVEIFDLNTGAGWIEKALPFGVLAKRG
ncbi:SAM-dependent methyltransferase [Rhizomicrobium palustre]|uniref:SAM-dependent methyltransferase n=1 Tax=Rhizomicrobium palustre TaxID=189966 RepID=A0A846MV30_9PROT|nr:class I SAM-dependent methyltransferase [Rhizomicrobium palustre]NIK87041.1 SAM-dependent methyltransferase [Rhizomicrobium palustre]